MELSPEQQEHYARHLILEGFGGEGQERLLAAGVRVHGRGDAALWAARYLAASGVGRLTVEVESWAAELRALGPWLAVDSPAPGSVPEAHQQASHEVSPPEGSGPAESAMNGAQAALDLVRAIAGGAGE
jgi:hypothetical protein